MSLHADSRLLRNLFRVASLFTFLAVVGGSVVAATESGAACPTWPGCYPGQIGPGWHLNPLIEFTHRLVAISATPLVLVCALLARKADVDPWVKRLPWFALVGCFLAGLFGMMIVLFSLPKALAVLDLFASLMAMSTMAIATLRLEAGRGNHSPTTMSNWGRATAAVLIVMHLLGIVVAGQGSFTRVMGWPLQIIDTDVYPWLQWARLSLAVAATIGVGVLAWLAVRQRGWNVHALVLVGLLAAEAGLAYTLRTQHIRLATATAYAMVAVALLWAVVLMAGRAAQSRPDAGRIRGRRVTV